MSSVESLFASEIKNSKMKPAHPIKVGLKQELEGKAATFTGEIYITLNSS